MLDEEEFYRVDSLRWKGIEGTLLERLYAPMLKEYERITGFHETNIGAIYHHRLSLYGPPCNKCNRPLRSPNAKLCGSCMHPVFN